MAPSQRALWTFLFYALVAPFFAALAVVLIVALASGLGWSVPLSPTIGEAAIGAFVWSALPAVATGLVLAAFVLRYGGFSWISAAVVATIAFALATLVTPFGLEEARPYLAFLAGLVAVAVHRLLLTVGIFAA